MSSNNDNSELVFVLVIIVLLVELLIYAAIAFFVFYAIFYTVHCLLAWDEPRMIDGKILTPEKARSVIKRGLWGAMLGPIARVFIDLYKGHDLPLMYDLPWLMVGSYLLASLLPELLKEIFEEVFETEPVPQEPPLTIDHDSVPPQCEQPHLPKRKFNFASWDDEEEEK